MAEALFASKAEAEAFALTVVGFMCGVGVHGSGCGWIDRHMEGPGLRPWPMPVGRGVKAWCQCSCHPWAVPAGQLTLGI